VMSHVRIGKLVKLKPINNRFKQLIHDFGEDWITVNTGWPMACFNNSIGVTCRPCNNWSKFSNFKLEDIE